MRPNVIILTSGLSGSSVLAGLIAGGGWWAGDQTFKKADYDTFENQRLIDLNRSLFERVGYTGNYEMVFEPEAIGLFARPPAEIDPGDYRAFVADCDVHAPWLWKDPRLWLTIHYWRDLIDIERIRFIHLIRDPMQAWVSLTIRRQIQEYGYLKDYLDGIDRSIRTFLAEADARYLELQYEELLVRPEQTLARLNDFLGSAFGVQDLQQIYRGALYRRPKGMRDALKAGLIYVKNYRERYR